MDRPNGASIRMAVGQQVRNGRRAARLTQRELAARIYRSTSWLRGVEQGRREPTLPELAAIASVLKIDWLQMAAAALEVARSPQGTAEPLPVR
ncbi:MAG: helix-turn-helix transcriptional regulator [Gammaproteobacteria bacterium]